MKKKITILFDLDGTLIDSTEAILESFHASYSQMKNVAPDDEAIKALIGYPLEIMFSQLGAESSFVDEHVYRYKAHYRKIALQKTTLLEHAKEAIEEAASFARLGVVTTKTAKYSVELLEHMGVMHLFEVLVGREDVKSPKPNAEPIHKALSQMGCRVKDSWIIGDTKLDLIAAKNAGILSVGVLSGYGKRETLRDYTSHITTDSHEAVRLIYNYYNR